MWPMGEQGQPYLYLCVSYFLATGGHGAWQTGEQGQPYMHLCVSYFLATGGHRTRHTGERAVIYAPVCQHRRPQYLGDPTREQSS